MKVFVTGPGRPSGSRPGIFGPDPPFGGAQQVLEYLGRYTHRVAISNHRLHSIGEDGVTFDYKDYSSQHPQRTRRMTLAPDEFIRRFLLHTLDAGFQRIRHYGLLASRGKAATLALCQSLLEATALLPSPAQIAQLVRHWIQPATLCPVCGVGEMVRVELIASQPYRPAVVDTS